MWPPYPSGPAEAPRRSCSRSGTPSAEPLPRPSALVERYVAQAGSNLVHEATGWFTCRASTNRSPTTPPHCGRSGSSQPRLAAPRPSARAPRTGPRVRHLGSTASRRRGRRGTPAALRNARLTTVSGAPVGRRDGATPHDAGDPVGIEGEDTERPQGRAEPRCASSIDGPCPTTSPRRSTT